jgi:hypothetical protein
MSKFMIKFTYSCGSWARMVKVTDDRTTAVRALVESLGGSLDQVFDPPGSSAIDPCPLDAMGDLDGHWPTGVGAR